MKTLATIVAITASLTFGAGVTLLMLWLAPETPVAAGALGALAMVPTERPFASFSNRMVATFAGGQTGGAK